MTWLDRIEEAETEKGFGYEDAWDACQWDSCAVGELWPDVPVEDLSYQVRRLGRAFGTAVIENEVKAARLIYLQLVEIKQSYEGKGSE